MGNFSWDVSALHDLDILGLYRDYKVDIRVILGIMEKNMETTIMGYIGVIYISLFVGLGSKVQESRLCDARPVYVATGLKA